jgi:hypothetical protein
MEPVADSQESSGKSKKKKPPKKAKPSEELSVSEGTAHPLAAIPKGELENKIENIGGCLELVWRYVRQKPRIGLSFAFAIGIVTGTLCRDRSKG